MQGKSARETLVTVNDRKELNFLKSGVNERYCAQHPELLNAIHHLMQLYEGSLYKPKQEYIRYVENPTNW